MEFLRLELNVSRYEEEYIRMRKNKIKYEASIFGIGKNESAGYEYVISMDYGRGKSIQKAIRNLYCDIHYDRRDYILRVLSEEIGRTIGTKGSREDIDLFASFFKFSDGEVIIKKKDK